MYDVICIGGGLNYSAAVILAKAGKKVVLIEENLEHIGGTCLHNGCIPSKNLLHRAKTIIETKEDIFTQTKINLKKLNEKINDKLLANTKAITTQIKNAGVELIEGKGFVVDDGVEINSQKLQAKYIIIGTGSRPRIPENIEYDGKHIITSDEALQLTKIPKEISIYGSGAIGIEMASLFASFGTKVNLIYRHNTISSKIDAEITKNMEKQLQFLGVNLIPNSSIKKAYSKNNKAIIEIENKTIESDYLLLAVGRIPNIEVIKTDKIKIDKGIKTDEFFETTLKNVFAIGDVNGKVLLAHAARSEALNVVDIILGKKEVLNLNLIPKFIYTLPLSYAMVGQKTQKQANFKIAHLGMSGTSLNDNDGIVIIYVDEDNFVTGGEIFAPNAEELISIFSTAITAEMDIELFKKVVFPHPTYSEAIDRTIRRIR